MKEIPVIYEDNEILLINKKSGFAVQGGEKVTNPVDNLLKEQMGYKVYPVHRLDKDTAGLLIVAKSSAAAAKWTGLVASKAVEKQYAALCIGLPPGVKTGSANAAKGVFLSDIEHGKQKKSAYTEYQLVDSAVLPLPQMQTPESAAPVAADLPALPEVCLSLLRLTLGTGRMHQIRIHLAQAGCPIAADDKYGFFKLNKQLRKSLGIKTLQLVAIKLRLPLNNGIKEFQIPLPPHMQEACIKVFGKDFRF